MKEEKETQKPVESAAKLQNGDGSKEGTASTAAATASGASEEKKKAKTRFMFNIADGGFTGTRWLRLEHNSFECFQFSADSRVSLRAPLTVAERGARCHGNQENQRDLASPPRLLAAGRHHTVSFAHLSVCLASLETKTIALNVRSESVVSFDLYLLQTRLRPLAGHPERRQVRHPQRAF